MDIKQKSILRAFLRVAVAAMATALAWVSDALFACARHPADNEFDEEDQDLHVVIEDGFLKAKAGEFEAPMQELNDPRVRKR